MTQALDVLEDSIIAAYAKLWTLKDSFLVCRFSRIERKGTKSLLLELDELYDTLNALGRLTVDGLKEHRTIRLSETRIPHVSFVTWIHGVHPLTYSEGLANVKTMVDADDIDQGFWPEFLPTLWAAL
ncbi:hypothetical protein PsYK624_094920 [Phanerochaete sordida]|uniref:Uncharacterized protein n=1 Tax=Phanerochaete sordida TaxID=48140 RepID=A0A9P3GC14_9APHY|nr:hypothetical protein PsYK624_094920 [Phanerochaete sordida]